tara:strand:- start:237 stop:1784 length:1548 start_codon:yes stop_codon:yes gene_type:complete
MLTMRSALKRAARLFGKNTAIIDAEWKCNWSEHMDRVMRLSGLLEQLEINKGDRFAIISRNTWRHCELLHAGYWNGSVPVPVNYRLAPLEINQILKDASIKRLFVEDFFRDLMDDENISPWREKALCIPGAGIKTDIPSTEEFLTRISPSAGSQSDEDEDAILLYTGGTTGESKGVRLTHRNIFSNGQQNISPMQMKSQDVYLHVAPMFHSADLLGTGYTLTGAAHAYLPEFSSDKLLQAIQDYRVTSAMMPPTMIILTLQEPAFSSYDLSSLDRLYYGSSPMAVEWIRRTMEAFPSVNIQQGYGLTETAPILTTLDEDIHNEAIKHENYDVLKAAGRPLVGIDMQIVNNDGLELPLGGEGEVVVRGPNVTVGYLNRPEENKRAFKNGWFHTGDVGKMDENGFLYLLDRKKDVIITGGENVYSSEVEAVIYQHENVHECAVVGIPDDVYGEALFAVIVVRPGTSLTVEELITHCRGKIGGFKIPRQAAFVNELPKSAMGKILKTTIRENFKELCR